MTDPTTFDIAIIGGGAAGVAAAHEAATLGAKAVLIEKERLGGRSLWSEVPSQTLLKSSRVCETIKRAEEFGVHVEQTRFVWPAMRMRIADVRDEIRKLQRQRLDQLNVELLIGAARFIDVHTLEVATKAGLQAITAKQFIIATGSTIQRPRIPGLEETGYLTPESFFELANMPRSLIILGDDAIACELGQALQRFGCKTTILHEGDRLLPNEDTDIAAECRRILENEGVAIHLNVDAKQTAIDEKGSKRLTLASANGEEQTVTASQLLVTTGETVAADDLNLTAVGVSASDGRLIVDEYLCTTAPHIHACGAVSGASFSHIAGYQANLAVRNALSNDKAEVNYRAMPWAIFTDPPIAHLGLTEAEVQQEHPGYRVYRADFNKLDRAIIEGEAVGFMKIITTDRDEVLGVHIIGAHADELIHQFVSMQDAISIYPTLSEIVRRPA